MNCTQCQLQLQPNWNYCPNCGEAVKQISEGSMSQEETIAMELDYFPMGFNPDLYDL